MTPDTKEIRELEAEMAKLLGWRDVKYVSETTNDWVGVEELYYFLVPKYLSDSNAFDEFVDWLCSSPAVFHVTEGQVGNNDHSCYIGARGIETTEITSEETRQLARYNAIKEALPKIKEIVGEGE